MGFGTRSARLTLAGVRLARQAANQIRDKQATEAFVAGAIGPLGVRLEPLGKIGLDEARAAFEEQIAALVEDGPGVGVDLLSIETMTSLTEAEQAVAAARAIAPEIPVIVMVTVDEEGNCLDGTSAEAAAQRLTATGAQAIGCNCSAGPATVLSVIERMRPLTTLPLAAMPNAGIPPGSRRKNDLSHLAGVHGELHAQAGEGRRLAGGWLLRNNSKLHPCHAGCAPCTGCNGVRC